MHWSDEGYLLSKNNFDENSIIIEAFTLRHGKYSGLVYGGASRKQKKIFQIGNKIFLNWKSKRENRTGYFNVELIKPIAPSFFDDKKRSVCLLSITSILKLDGNIHQVPKTVFPDSIFFLIILMSLYLYIYGKLDQCTSIFQLAYDHFQYQQI